MAQANSSSSSSSSSSPSWSKAARKAWTDAAPADKPHLLACFCGHWVSQARLGSQSCDWCGSHDCGRAHEWACPNLRSTAHTLVDDLHSQLAWPRPGDMADHALLLDLCEIQRAVLQVRYPAGSQHARHSQATAAPPGHADVPTPAPHLHSQAPEAPPTQAEGPATRERTGHSTAPARLAQLQPHGAALRGGHSAQRAP